VTEDYLLYYNAEKYLFEEVRNRFEREQRLDAFDLFTIIIWKAERAKSKLATRLSGLVPDGNLETVAASLSADLIAAKTPEERLIVLMDKWEFYLPMSTAILSVLWPEEFTVFDVRVCEELESNERSFKRLGNLAAAKIWPEYCKFREAVKDHVKEPYSLREKDRFLWGRSTAIQLREQIKVCFRKN
jgi:hypothetical protein